MTQKVIGGDVFEEIAELEEDSAHAVIVDYPWEFSTKSGSGRHGEPRKQPREDTTDCEIMFSMESDGRLKELIEQLERVLVDGAWMIFMSDDRFQDPIRDALRDADQSIFRRNWCWTPEDIGMGYYGRIDHYPIPVATNGETKRYVRDRSTLFTIPNGRSVDYPTGKPVELYRQLLQPPVVKEGEKLLEPFCGSGPGAAVAYERGLKYWGCDVSSEAVESTEDRIARSTKSLLDL